MKSLLRPSALGEVIRKMAPSDRRRDVLIDPEGGFFGVKNLTAALKRCGRGDVIHIPSGEYPACDLSKAVEIRGLQGAVVRIKGTLRIRSDAQIVLSGLTLQAESGSCAIELLKGVLFLDDCVVQGEISVGSPEGKTEFFARNCLLENGVVGVNLSHQGSAEIHTSRITGCRIGLSLQPGSAAAIYDSRVEACLSAEESDPGAGISAENATVYCEGTTFSRNTVGAYLKNYADARFLSSHFHASETASLIASHDPASLPLQLWSCSFDGQTTARCAQISLTGGAAVISRTQVAAAPAPALSVEETRLEIRDSSLASLEEPALEARSSHITAKGLTATSTRSAGLFAVSCHGILRESRFEGEPPTAIEASLQLMLEACTSRQASLEPETAPTAETPVSDMAALLQKLQATVSQEVVRNELERILRLAHASQQRRLGGLPVPDQSYHSIFMGPPGTGKLAAARLLAEGLHAFGVLPSPHIEEISLATLEGGPDPRPGVIFVRVHEATGTEADQEKARRIAEQLVKFPDGIVILDGERDELRRLLRQSALLDRAFRHTVYFTSYGPLELAELFAQLCDRDRIPMSKDAMRTILLAFHLYCERRDRRYANTRGVEMLYESTRRRYLGRCSVTQRVDLELEPCDVEIPQDKLLLTVLERSPAFVSFCPACTRENTWLPGLSPQVQCLHCEGYYTARWGVWKDSACYRRMKEALNRPALLESPLAQRTTLPPVH